MKKVEVNNLPFSNFMHVGVIVRDMGKAVEHLSSLGIGPWKPLPTSGPVELMFRGKAGDWSQKISTAKIGQIELELIQPLEGESIYKEFLDNKGEGIQHLAFVVDDLDRQVATLTNQGLQILTSGRWKNGGFTYLGTNVGGIVIELFKE